jgi:hypothetical protein
MPAKTKARHDKAGYGLVGIEEPRSRTKSARRGTSLEEQGTIGGSPGRGSRLSNIECRRKRWTMKAAGLADGMGPQEMRGRQVQVVGEMPGRSFAPTTFPVCTCASRIQYTCQSPFSTRRRTVVYGVTALAPLECANIHRILQCPAWTSRRVVLRVSVDGDGLWLHLEAD